MALAAVLLGPFILALFSSVNSQSAIEYVPIADLDYCGQSCPSSCEEAEARSAVCRCDSECERYGDCCSPPSGRLNCTGGEQRAQPLAGLQCRSIHLDSRTQPRWMEAFWMVSACPEDWLASQGDEVLREVEEECSNGSDTLPPVTGLDGGVVYKNEYCAVCHQVANIQPWGYRFGCSPCLKDELESRNVNLTREVIEEECIACGFHVPETWPPPRHCLHDSLVVGECLAREVLEERTGLRWEEEVYSGIVLQCQIGPVRPVDTNLCNVPPTYRNQYCAICNALKTTDLSCGTPYANPHETLDYCLAEANSCDSSTHNSKALESYTLQSQTLPHGPRMKKSEPSESGSDENTTEPTVPETEPEVITCGTSGILYGSFPLFFDVTGDSGVVTSDIVSSKIVTSCSKGQVFDPINQACRQTVCPGGFATIRVSCTIVQNITLVETYNSSNDSLIMCDEGLIILHESEFEIVDNDTILFRNNTFEIAGYDGSSPIICSNFTQNGTIQQNETKFYYSYSSAFYILTYVGCSLSVVGCVVVILTYSLFKELRTLPGQILMNLASTILATSLFLLVGIPIAVLAEKDELCEATAIFLHWLMLSQFSWMSIMSFELLRTFYRASQLQSVEDKSRKKIIFLLYFLIGWGFPFLLTLITVIVNYSSDVIQYGRDGFCWIGHVPSFYVVFLAPVALSIVFNGVTFVITFSLLYKASRTQAKLKKQQNTSYVRIYLSVFSISGLTWAFGFLAIVVRDDWAWYAFIILTSTQGLVICTAFIFTQKVGGLYKEFFFSSLTAITAFKSSSKQSTKVTPLVKHMGKSDNASVESSKSVPTPDETKLTEMAVQNKAEQNKAEKNDLSIETGL